MNHNNQKSTHILARIGLLVFICCLFGFLISMFTDSDISGFCAGVGTFFLILLCIGKSSQGNIKKRGILTTATVASCKRNKVHDISGVLISDYYEVIYDITVNNETVQHIERFHAPVETQRVVAVYYDRERDQMIEKDSKKNKGYKFCAIASVVLYIVAAFAAVITKMDSAQKAIQVILTYMQVVFTYSIGPIFAFIGILLLRKPIMYRINEHRMQRIHGELIEYIRKISSDDDSSIYTYYPVYKYWDKGEYREYRSSVGSGRRKGKIGDSVELFLDENGNVFEAGEMKSQFFLGVVFLIIGLATIGLMLYKELL